MFSWFNHADPDEVKKVEPFKISWYRKGGPLVTGSGVEISETGLVFTTSMPPPEYKDFNVEFEVREKLLHARVESKKPQLRATPQGLQHQYVCRFTGIAADEWDRIVRYVNDTPEATHEGPFYDPTVADDEFRSLTSAIQEKIIEDLSKKERVEAPPPGVAPLIRMTLQSEQKTKDGKHIKKYTIHSRVVVQGEEVPKDFDTRYAIDENGNVVCQTETKK